MKNPVQCKDCGYLALVRVENPPPFPIKPHTFPSKEVELSMRQPDFFIPTYQPIRCHIEKANLDEELRAHLFRGIPAVEENMTIGKELPCLGAWPRLITRHRECGGFTPYIHGLSPNEHLAEERRKKEKRKDRRYEVCIIALTAFITASLLTVGEVLFNVFWK